MFLHIDDNEVFMRYCRFRGDIVVFLVYLVWDIVADFKIVGVKKNGICIIKFTRVYLLYNLVYLTVSYILYRLL